MRAHTPVDNTVHDLRYEMKFENCVKDKNNFFIKWNISFLFLEMYFFKIPKNLIALTFFFLLRQILKNIDIPQQKQICQLPRRISNAAD